MFVNAAYVSVRKTPNMGNGVFAKISIPAGTVIGDYLGRLVKYEQATRYERKIKAFYSMSWDYNDDLVIWPNPEVPGVHTINHSCMNNCEFADYKGHVLVVANRRIHPREQLTVGYNLERPDVGSKEGSVPCYCNTPLCRGTMHVAEDAGDGNKSAPDMRLPEAKLKAGDTLPPLKKYPTTRPVPSYYSAFGAYRVKPIVRGDRFLPSRKVLLDLIRSHGRNVSFPAMGLIVHGVMAKHILSEATG